MNRQKSTKDIRSRIKHENVNLGGGTEMGGVPNNQGLHSNTFAPPFRQQQGVGHHVSASTASNHSVGAPMAIGPFRSGSGDTGLVHHQPHPLGAGPSFVSLSPSDSISNFEGRPGGAFAGMAGQLFEPSAGSTASFAQAQPEAATPLRPARSGRRPQQLQHSEYPADVLPSGSSPASAGRNLLNSESRPRGLSDASEMHIDGNGPVDRHARSAKLMAQVANPHDGRATPNSIDMEDEMAGDQGGYEAQYASARAHDAQSTTSPPLGSLSRGEEPAALGSVLTALTKAGRKKGQARMLRGTTAEEESRRRKSERKVETARAKESRPLEHYIDRKDEVPFREIFAVLRKVQEEWGFVVEDDFNSVALALSLLDDSSLGASKHDFEEVKNLIERALQGTVDGASPAVFCCLESTPH